MYHRTACVCAETRGCILLQRQAMGSSSQVHSHLTVKGEINGDVNRKKEKRIIKPVNVCLICYFLQMPRHHVMLSSPIQLFFCLPFLALSH